jgi:polyferredoxin
MVTTLPILACRYIDKRILNCFFHYLQEYLTSGFGIYFKNLILPVVTFILFIVIMGNIWCGWVCPMGFLQDLISDARKLLKLSYIKFSQSWIARIKITKYTLIIIVLLISILIGIPGFFMKAYMYDLNTPFCQICPAKKILSSMAGNTQYLVFIDDMTPITKFMSYLSLAVGLLYILGTATIRRFWCRICPTRILIGLTSKLSMTFLIKEGQRCTKCGICARSCPVQIKKIYEEKDEKNMNTVDCTLCMRCVEMCPEDKCLKVTFFNLPLATSSNKRFNNNYKLPVFLKFLSKAK